MKQQLSAWEMAADDVLAVMYYDRTAYERAVWEIGLMADMWPNERYRAAYRAIADLWNEGREQLHDTLVVERAAGHVDATWLAQRAAGYDTLVIEAFADNVEVLIREGQRARRVRATEELLRGLRSGNASHDDIANAVYDLTADTGLRITRETAGEHGEDIEAYLNSPQDKLHPTGIEWVDTLTGGLVPGRLWWIGGPYKSRKTSFALNILLSSVLSNGGVSAAMLSAEMPRQDVGLQMIAMLAAGYLRAAGEDIYKHTLLSAENLSRARQGYKRWPGRLPQAVAFAARRYREIEKRLRIYDRSQQGGGLSDYASIERLVKRDIAMYDANLFVLDYLQLLNAPGNSLYEKVAYLSLRLQELTVRENITMIVLAQLNEDTIRNGSSYSPGVKGGGDPAATANYFLTTSYKTGDYEDDDTKLQVQMKLSRHSMSGGPVRTPLDIHPASGLVLDSRWIDRIKREVSTRN